MICTSNKTLFILRLKMPSAYTIIVVPNFQTMLKVHKHATVRKKMLEEVTCTGHERCRSYYLFQNRYKCISSTKIKYTFVLYDYWYNTILIILLAYLISIYAARI